jgi:CheY-like chemotaxis protein
MAAARRVLVVGDDRVERERLRAELEADGHVVDVCVDGEAALVHLRAVGVAPTMVVLDLEMLDLSGWTLIDGLRGDPRLADVPFAVLAHGHDDADLAGLTVFRRPVAWPALRAWCAHHARS